jgi:cytochrome c-type biogenesis protein CcmH
MTGFWIIAVLLIGTALFFILPPLLGKNPSKTVHAKRDEVNLEVLRDQLRELNSDLEAGIIEAPAYESARHELERRVIEDVQPETSITNMQSGNKRLVTLGVSFGIPAIVAALYFLLGNPSALDSKQVVASNEKSHSITPEQIENMVERLATRLQSNPNDAEGWVMLARSYTALSRYTEASKAYERLVALNPGDAQLLADYADTLAMAQNRSLQGEPEKIIGRALEVDPKNIKALALFGSAAFERRAYSVAVARWQKILAIVPPDSDIARSTNGSISEAQTLASDSTAGTVPTASASTQQEPPAQATGAQVEGTVELDSALRSQAAEGDTVFIFARASEGPRFPLAVLRKQVKDLPTTFVLDDSMSMVPGAKLSGFPLVVVGARISKSGSATPASGDLEGLSSPVRPGTKNLKIRINSRHN